MPSSERVKLRLVFEQWLKPLNFTQLQLDFLNLHGTERLLGTPQALIQRRSISLNVQQNMQALSQQKAGCCLGLLFLLELVLMFLQTCREACLRSEEVRLRTQHGL